MSMLSTAIYTVATEAEAGQFVTKSPRGWLPLMHCSPALNG